MPAEIYTAETVIDDYGYPNSEAELERNEGIVGTERVPAEPLSGIHKLLAAYKASCGKDPPNRRADLRDEYYGSQGRKRGESVINFLSAHRSLLAKMRLEGIELDEEQVVYNLKRKLNLNETQMQLLETVVGSEPSQAELEAQVSRLFKRIHQSVFGGGGGVGSSSSSSSSRSSVSRSTLARRLQPSSGRGSSSGHSSASRSSRRTFRRGHSTN